MCGLKISTSSRPPEAWHPFWATNHNVHIQPSRIPQTYYIPMNPDLTIGDVIAQIDEEGAFRFFFYTTEEYPLDPGGGDGMAHLAHFYGQLDRASIYASHVEFLARGPRTRRLKQRIREVYTPILAPANLQQAPSALTESRLAVSTCWSQRLLLDLESVVASVHWSAIAQVRPLPVRHSQSLNIPRQLPQVSPTKGARLVTTAVYSTAASALVGFSGSVESLISSHIRPTPVEMPEFQRQRTNEPCLYFGLY